MTKEELKQIENGQKLTYLINIYKGLLDEGDNSHVIDSYNLCTQLLENAFPDVDTRLLSLLETDTYNLIFGTEDTNVFFGLDKIRVMKVDENNMPVVVGDITPRHALDTDKNFYGSITFTDGDIEKSYVFSDNLTLLIRLNIGGSIFERFAYINGFDNVTNCLVHKGKNRDRLLITSNDGNPDKVVERKLSRYNAEYIKKGIIQSFPEIYNDVILDEKGNRRIK